MRSHGAFLDAIDVLDDVRCFGLTELGCALTARSSARSMCWMTPAASGGCSGVAELA